jgi:hypothetical protein
MKILEIELYRFHNLIFGKIIHQDESLRNTDNNGSKIINNKTGLLIESISCPDLFIKVNGTLELYIRGYNKKYDDRVFSIECTDDKEAIYFSDMIKYEINEINKNIKINKNEECENNVIKVI